MLLNAKTIVLEPSMHGVKTFSQISIFEDISKKFGIEDIKKQKFKSSQSVNSNQGASSSNWWLKLEVQNSTIKPIDWFLKFSYGQIDEMKSWQFNEDGTLLSYFEKGDHYIDESKVSLQNRTTFEFNTLRKTKNTIYIKLAYENAGIIEMFNHIWTKDEFIKSQALRFNFIVGILSALTVLLFYNIFIWVVLRRKEYFWYCTYVLGVILSTLTFNQLGAHYLWNQSLYFIDMMPFIAGTVLFSSFILFTREFLETNKHLPKVDKILKILLLVNLIIFVLPHVGARHLAIVFIFLLTLSFVFSPFLGAFLWYRGHKIARGYTISTFFLSIAIIISLLRFFSVVESSEFIFWIARFGFIIEGILFSIALADRISLLQNNAKHNLEVEVKKRTLELEIQTKRAQELARTDPMTGIANRRAFFEKGEEFIQNYLRYNKAFSLIILDIDHFKHVNDKYGHEVGDLVIVSLTKAISQCIRETDFFARIGGEEFTILLSHANSSLAMEKTKKLLQMIRNLEIEHNGELLKVTVSMGLCEYTQSEISIYSLLKKADRMLYYVKEHGRNNIKLYEDN